MGRIETNFKQTEVGLIPEDWEVDVLGQLAEVLDNLRVPLNDNQRLKMKGEIPYCGANGIVDYVDDYVVDDDIILMAEDGGYFDEYKTRPIAYRMIGKAWVNNHAHILKAKISTNQGYLFYSLVHKNILDFINGGTRAKLNKGDLINIKISFPPNKTEQTAIANALSDADVYIESLEKLIDKKQKIKQGSLQQLLKPKENWEVKKLGDVVNIKKGELITNNTRVNGDIPVIAGGRSFAYYNNKANRFGKTITISASGASAGYVAFHNYPIFASDCSTIEEGENYSIEFVFFFLQLLQDKIYKMQTGGAQPHIHPSDLNPIEIIIPKTKTEQQQIAQILSDIDNEITALTQKLTKAKAIKQGMMQQLLTGKIRFI